MKRIINILLLLFVQTITFAQGVGVDSMQVESALVDSVADNTIKDTIVLKYSRGIVPFETIAREGTKYYAVTSDGHKEEITSFINGRKRVMVKDGDGHELVIDIDGNIMGVEEYRASGGNERLLKTFNAKKDSLMSTTDNITFEKVETENYGFDKWRGEEYDRDQYPTITDNNDYRPAYIGAEKEKTIRIKVNKTKGITFKSERGVPLIANEKDNTIAFNCGTTGRQAIYAYRDSTVVGKVNVQAYSYKDVKVHLVRVNGATKRLDVEAITKGVNEIFDDAVVRYTFDELDPITIEYANKERFVHGGKGTFQNYNEDQKTAIKALPETADQNDYYLFFVECFDRLDTAGNVSKEIVNGYMPVGRHYGFIYNEYTNTRTIAHELAHGTNALHHTFSPESETFYTTSKTDNLMDYHAGKTLTHTQWQWSHEKHRNVLGFLDDEGESENISLTGRFYAILNGNKDYKLYDKSSITVLGGTELSFDVLPDDFVYNQVHDYLKSKLNEDSLLSFKIKLNKTIELKNEKSEVVNFSRLPIGAYTCSIQINIESLYGLVIHNDVKSAFKLPFKRYAYNFSINVEVVEKPIARLEPADRENFFLKFGYDDALVKENQDRADYPQEIIAGQVYYVPWLHIQPNIEAEMKLDFKFDETFVSKLTSIIGAKQDKEYTLSFIVKGDNGIKINGKDSVEVPIDKIDEILKMSCSAERNGFVSIYAKNFITGKSELAGKLEVECRPMKTIGTIKVYSAKRYDEDKYPTINQDEILEFVNKYYVQAGVRFDLDSTAVALFEIKTKSIKEVLNIEQDFINETLDSTFKCN